MTCISELPGQKPLITLLSRLRGARCCQKLGSGTCKLHAMSAFSLMLQGSGSQDRFVSFPVKIPLHVGIGISATDYQLFI